MSKKQIALEAGQVVEISGCNVSLSPLARGPTILIVEEAKLDKAEVLLAIGAEFKCRYKRPDSCSPAQEQKVLQLASDWSRYVTRLTVLSQARFQAIHARLQDYDFEILRGAVKAYGTDSWHLAERKFKPLTRWFKPETIETWIAKAEEVEGAVRKQEEKGLSDNRDVRDMVSRIAAAKSVKDSDRREARERQLEDMPTAEREALLDQAFEEHTSVYPEQVDKAWRSFNCYPVRQQALVILKRRDERAAIKER